MSNVVPFARPLDILSAVTLCGLLLCTAPAFGATAQRTFVKSNGSDASPTCSLVAPCRSFNIAIGLTTPGGEVVILDTAGYGPMTIDRAIKIIGPSGVYGGISVLGAGATTTGIVIAAGASDVITLRGLDIGGVPTGAPLPNIGIDIQSAGAVHIEKTSISNFTQDASECIRISSAQLILLFIDDSFLRECATGIHVNGTVAGGTVPIVSIDNTRIERGTNTQSGTAIVGVKATGNYYVTIRNSDIKWGLIGVLASQTTITDTPAVTIIGSQITLMAVAGIQTGPGPGTPNAGPLRINIQHSSINASAAAIKHGYGTVRLTDNVISTVTHMLTNCGSDQFWGPYYATDNLGNTIGSNFLVDFTNPGAASIGCVTYNSPGKLIAQ